MTYDKFIGVKKMSDIVNQTIDAALELAFEAGKWAGQVELEEHINNEQYSMAGIEAVYTRKIPKSMFNACNGREARIWLRSDAWKKGVTIRSIEYREKAKNYLLKLMQDK